MAFFTNVNPLFDDGAILHYSKSNVNHYIPARYRPFATLITNQETIPDQIKFPIICKPDSGERGKQVSIIRNKEQLDEYLETRPTPTIIEEYIDLPNEAGIFYVNSPSKGPLISSITTKEFLGVRGDGIHDIKFLLEATLRGRLQVNRLSHELLMKVPEVDQYIMIEPIGNHNRGTKFINANHLISKKLLDVFHELSVCIPDFHYGRYDIKYEDWDQVLKGNFKVIELNMVNSEPVHIYDQEKTGLFRAIADLKKHWDFIAEISIFNSQMNKQPISAFQFIKFAFARK